MLNLIHSIVDFIHPTGCTISRPEGNNMYTLLLFKNPVAILQDGELIMTKSNAFIIFNKWSTQLYYNNDNDYKHDGIFFDNDIESVPEILNSLDIPLNTIFYTKNPMAVSTVIKQIATEASLQEKYTNNIVDLLIRELLFKIAGSINYTGSYSHNYYLQFLEIRNNVFNHPEKSWHGKDLCDEINISLSRFQHLYKEFFNTSLVQDVIQSRIKLAQYLLKSTSYSICMISTYCGYSNEEHFLRQFKNLTDTTPKQYRNSNFAYKDL